ncbi:MAG: DUF1553 domain-containing protein [Verrucomicrobiota bacterium]
MQALNLFNSRFTLDQSRALAARVEGECGPGATLEEQIRHAYRRVVGRPPTARELAEDAPVVRQHGLATLGRALFNSSEFLFLP